MPVNELKFRKIITDLSAKNVELVAVSKIQSVTDIKKLYELGQRDFGENYVQELVEKQPLLPPDLRWHFIGHLQTNKVKKIAPFVYLIQGVDSMKLLLEINKHAKKLNKTIRCLLQVHITQEETKFGLDEAELEQILAHVTKTPEKVSNILISGLMGMASFSDDIDKVRREMNYLKMLFDKYKSVCADSNGHNCSFTTLSMGMSGDYKIAIQEGSNMVRIGSLLFGARPAK